MPQQMEGMKAGRSDEAAYVRLDGRRPPLEGGGGSVVLAQRG